MPYYNWSSRLQDCRRKDVPMKQAVILCGGRGTRLGNLTTDTAKPLLPVAGKPFLDHLLQEVTRWGFERVLMLAGYHGDILSEMYHGKTFNHARCEVVVETDARGTLGALVNAHQHLDDYFMLFNGDSWIDYDLTDMTTMRPERIHMLGRYTQDASRHETLETHEGMVAHIHKRGINNSGVINSGVYVINKKTVTMFLQNDMEMSLENGLIPAIIQHGNVTVSLAELGTFFIDIGIPQDYERAQTDIVLHRTRPALFIDRDNTLTYDRAGYTHHPDDMEFKPGAVELIQQANRAGYYVFVITNQGGVTKGVYQEHYVLEFHRKMQYNLGQQGAHIDALEYEIGLDSERRKPRPGMLLDIMASWPVDLDRSIMIGDKDSDREAGFNAGITGYKCDGTDLFEAFGKYII